MDQVNTLQFAKAHPSSVVIGGLIGGILAAFWPSIWENAQQVQDSMFPPVEVRAENIVHLPDAVEFDMLAKRLRADCQFESRAAFSVNGLPREINSARVEGDKIIPPARRQFPVGQEVNAGRFRMWPVDPSAKTVDMWSLYLCDGRQVQTKIVSIPRK